MAGLETWLATSMTDTDIILKHLLEMNEDLELSLSTFRRGLEIQFPNPTVFEDNFHLIDA